MFHGFSINVVLTEIDCNVGRTERYSLIKLPRRDGKLSWPLVIGYKPKWLILLIHPNSNQLIETIQGVEPMTYYLRQEGNVFAGLCLSVCLCVSKITQKVIDGFFWNFEGMSGMAETTSDSILWVIRKESWILDHFEIFVNIVFNGA